MTGPGVIFQCTSCRALAVAHDVVVGADGNSVGLVCGACARTSWLPVASVGGLRAEARAPVSAARALPPSSAATLPPPAPPSTEGLAADVASDAGPRPHAEGAAPLLAPPAPADAATATAATTAATATAAADAAPGPAKTAAITPATTPAFADDVVERIRARIAALGDVEQSRAPLAARFDRLLEGRWLLEAEHKALLKAAAVAGDLAFVGARYRAVLDVVRDEPRARAAQQELLTLAMATMKSRSDLEGTGGEAAPKSRLLAAIVAVIVVVTVIAGGWMVKNIVTSLQKLGTPE
jgi:hypothetical protein